MPFKTATNAVRYFFFPASQYISDKTEEIDHRLKAIKAQKEITSKMIDQVNQPDLLRTLVISMQNGGRVKDE